MSLHTKRLLVVLILAALVRGIMLWAVVQYPERMIRRDSDGYIQVAANLLAGHGFSQQNVPPYSPSAFRTPVFPMFIALLFVLFGKSNLIVAIAQVLITLLTVALTYWLGLKLLPENEAWIGALLYALSSGPATHSVFILTETLFALLLILVLSSVVLYRKDGQNRWLASAGLFTGLAMLCRPVAMLFPLVVFILIWLADPQNRQRAIKGMFVSLIICAIVVAPWIIRNFYQLGEPTLSTISSYYVLLYNAASINADQGGISQNDARSELQRLANEELARRGELGNEVGEAKLYDEWGWRIILAHPLRYAVIHLETDLNNFLPDVTDFLELMGVTQGAKGTLSVLNQQGIVAAIDHYFEGRIWLIGLVFPWIALLGLIYLGCVFGVYVLIKRKDWFGLALLLLPVLYYTLIPGPPSNPRFRVPVMPYLCLLAGIGCIQLAGWLITRRAHKVLADSGDY